MLLQLLFQLCELLFEGRPFFLDLVLSLHDDLPEEVWSFDGVCDVFRLDHIFQSKSQYKAYYNCCWMAQKMNQFLKERRTKLKEQAKFRKNRIIKHYHQNVNKYAEEKIEQLKNVENDPAALRKMQFYDQVFSSPNQAQNPNQNKNKKDFQQQPVDHSAEKLANLKSKKKKFIKKMKNQKTDRGQPLMRNYVKYALTKIEETLEKEKAAKIALEKEAKKNKKPTQNKSN